MVASDAVRAALYRLDGDSKTEVGRSDSPAEMRAGAAAGEYGTGLFRIYYLDAEGYSVGGEKFVVESSAAIAAYVPTEKLPPIDTPPAPEVPPEVEEQRRTIADLKASLDLLQAARETGDGIETARAFVMEALRAIPELNEQPATPPGERVSSVIPVAPVTVIETPAPPPVPAFPSVHHYCRNRRLVIIGGVPVQHVVDEIRVQIQAEVEWVATQAGSSMGYKALERRTLHGSVGAVVLIVTLMGHNGSESVVKACKASGTPYVYAHGAGTGQIIRAIGEIESRLRRLTAV